MKEEATREAYGKAIIDLARRDRNVYTMDCDLGRSTHAFKITEVDPERFVEMGISEQDMLSTAAGMASMGKIVFVNSFAVFLTGRAYDQIRQQVSLPQMNVKICGSSAGLTQGFDGATHQSVTDINLMRGLPNMVILSPADGRQTREIMEYAHAYSGPMYIRLSRYATPSLIPEGINFEFGKAQTLKEGGDIAFFVSGPILKNVLQAVSDLERGGISCGIFVFPTIKPMDAEVVRESVKRYPLVVSVEEHSIIGGLGSATAEIIASLDGNETRARLVRLGINDCYGESGAADELLALHRLDAGGIAQQARELLR